MLELGGTLEGMLREAELLNVFRDLDMPLLPVLHRMEERGIRIDPEVFRELSQELAADAEAIERKVANAAGTEFNIGSTKQLAFLLFEKLGLPPVKKTKTGYSTDMEVLEQLKSLHEIPALVLEYRTVAKIRSTYVDVLPALVDPRDGRIHTHLQPDAGGHRAALLLRPQPAEHPDPHRARAADPGRLRRGPGERARGRGLFPGGAAAAGAPLRRRRS